MTDQEFKELKADHERAKSDAARAQGSLDELKSQLKKEFGVESLKAARDLLQKFVKESEKLERELDVMVRDYKEAWHSDNGD